MKLRSKNKKIQTDQALTTTNAAADVELQVQIDDKDSGKDTTTKPPPTKRRRKVTDDLKSKKADDDGSPSSTVASNTPRSVALASNNNIQEFVENIIPNHENQKRKDVIALHQLVTRLAPQLDVNITDFKDTIAYGMYHFKYKSGREGDWYKMGISCGTKEISFHCCGLMNGKYMLESYPPKIIGKKCSVGKSCLRFKTLSDLHIDVVEKLILATAEADLMT